MSKILVVTEEFIEDGGMKLEKSGTWSMPDWLTDELTDGELNDKTVYAISQAMSELKLIHQGPEGQAGNRMSFPEDGFKKVIASYDEALSKKEIDTIFKLLLKHNVIEAFDID